MEKNTVLQSYFSFAENTKKFLEEAGNLAEISKERDSFVELHNTLEQLYIHKKNTEIWLYGIVFETMNEPLKKTENILKIESYKIYFLNRLSSKYDNATLRCSIEVAKSAKTEWLAEKSISEYLKLYQQIEICENKLKDSLGLYETL